MTFLDDERPGKPAPHEIGSDLSLLSADELSARIQLLRQEIERLEDEIRRKDSGRKVAESFFRS